jgi:hypothetical protein
MYIELELSYISELFDQYPLLGDTGSTATPSPVTVYAARMG